VETAELEAWIAFMKEGQGWTHARCAVALGVHPTQMSRWKKDGAPRYVGLACAAIVAELEPWAPARCKETAAQRRPESGGGNARKGM
jgi:hypothetical protein